MLKKLQGLGESLPLSFRSLNLFLSLLLVLSSLVSCQTSDAPRRESEPRAPINKTTPSKDPSPMDIIRNNLKKQKESNSNTESAQGTRTAQVVVDSNSKPKKNNPEKITPVKPKETSEKATTQIETDPNGFKFDDPDKTAKSILARLRKDPREAKQAFNDLCVIPTSEIPKLLPLVSSTDKTLLSNFKMYVPNRNYVSDERHGKQFLLNDVPGMGVMEEFDDEGWGRPIEYTKKSVGVTKSRKAYQIEVDNFRGFNLGVVIRAGLRNRFFLGLRENKVSSFKYPKGIDHRRHLNTWWKTFYATYKNKLEL